MRKITIVPAVALSLMTLGLIAEAAPASAHPSVMVAGEDGDTTDDTTAGSGTPSGGAGTGAGGTATEDTNSAAPWLAGGAVGIALLGASASTLRRRTVKA